MWKQVTQDKTKKLQKKKLLAFERGEVSAG